MQGHERRDELRGELRAQIDGAKAQFEATNAKIEQKAGRNLFLAVFSGIIFAAVFVVTLFTVKWAFIALVAALVTVALVELAAAFRVAGRRVPRVGAAIGGLTIVAGAAFFGAKGLLLALFAASVLLVLWRLVEGLVPAWEVPPKTLIRDVFSGLFALVYVPFLASTAVLLVQAPNGEWWVFALVLVVVSVDVGAYAAGVTLGKHKMTPRISPNKTWEGFAGAAVVAVSILRWLDHTVVASTATSAGNFRTEVIVGLLRLLVSGALRPTIGAVEFCNAREHPLQRLEPLPQQGSGGMDGHGLHAALQPAIPCLQAVERLGQILDNGLAIGLLRFCHGLLQQQK